MKNKKSFLGVFIFIMLSGSVFSQDCAFSLENAKRSYYNGNFTEAISLLEPCLDNGFSSEEQTEALELITKSSLMLKDIEKADKNMYRLLLQDPFFMPRESDLISFIELHGQYKIRTKFRLGGEIGFNIPDFTIMRYQSYASRTLEQEDYESFVGFSGQVFGEYSISPSLFLGLGLQLQSHGLEQQEIILEYQEITSRENLMYLSSPFYLKYQLNKWKINPFFDAGINLHYLLASNADIQRIPLEPEFPQAFLGTPEFLENYSLTFQRKNITLNFLVGAGLQYNLRDYTLQIALQYEYGYHNLVKEEKRYSDPSLTGTVSYVPDDFKMDHYRITIGVVKSIVYPKKRIR